MFHVKVEVLRVHKLFHFCTCAWCTGCPMCCALLHILGGWWHQRLSHWCSPTIQISLLFSQLWLFSRQIICFCCSYLKRSFIYNCELKLFIQFLSTTGPTLHCSAAWLNHTVKFLFLLLIAIDFWRSPYICLTLWVRSYFSDSSGTID